MKEGIIKDYLNNIDWNANWSYHKIREDLKILLGEKPAVFIKYDKEVMINEDTGKAVEYNEIDYIEITYTDLNTNNGLKYKKFRQKIEI